MICRKAWLSLLLLVSPVFAQGTHPVTGRKIAGVMGMAGADWLVRPEREAEEKRVELVHVSLMRAPEFALFAGLFLFPFVA